MKHMRVGKIKRPMGPRYYIKDIITGLKIGRVSGLQTAINKADAYGITAEVFKLGTCTRPVHTGTYA
jgi:hypothetical protein